MNKEVIVTIKPPFIKLNQLLKLLSLIHTGGEDKEFIIQHKIKVNDILESRRGRKIYENDVVEIDKVLYKIKYNENIQP